MDQWKTMASESPAPKGGFRSLVTLSKIVAALVALRVVCQALLACGTVGMAIAFPGAIDDPEAAGSAALPLLVLVGLTAIAWFGAVFIALPFWLYWHYQAGQNLLYLGREDLDYGPVGQVIWWFVPFANLVVPYRCMEELYTRSQPGDEMNPPPALFLTWWLCWIGSNIASNLSGRIGDGGIYLDVFALGVGIYAAVLYVRWVMAISALQEQAFILEQPAD